MSLKFQPLRVKAIVPETEQAYTIQFEGYDAQQFAYLPGQYLTLKVDIGSEVLRRAYSLSSSPVTDSHLSVTIKAVEGGRASNHLKQHLKPGDTLDSLPPMGNFIARLDPDTERHYVLIGGGSGITPLMSILKSVLVGEEHSRVSLIYVNTNEDCIIFRQALADLQGSYPGRLEVYHVLTQPEPGWTGPTGRFEGRLAFELLQKVIASDSLRKVFYLCGPQGLMDNAADTLELLNVGENLIHREYYSAPVADESDDAGAAAEEDYEVVTRQVKVMLDGKTTELTVTPDQTILQSAIKAKLDPPYACEEGVCCTCRAKVHSGMVAMRENEGLSESELNAGYVLTCQAQPLSDGVVVEFC